MRFSQFFTATGVDIFDAAFFRTETSDDFVEYIVPKDWSRTACHVLITDVFYKQALPSLTRKVEEEGVPAWLWRSEVDTEGLESVSAEWRYRFETDVRDVLRRVAGVLTYRGWKAGYFDDEQSAKIFHDEFCALVLQQGAMPEVSMLAHAGLDWAYGLTHAPAYAPRQTIFAFDDRRENEQGALAIPVITGEKEILKKIRLLDQSTPVRRSVILPVENVDAADFCSMKRQRDVEETARDLGLRMLSQGLHQVMDACDRDSVFGFDPARNLRLARAVGAARDAGIDETSIALAIDYAQQGYESIPFLKRHPDETAGGGVVPVLSVPDAFIESALTGHGFLQYEGGEPKRHVAAAGLFDHLCETMWFSGAPAVFFRDRASSPTLLMGNGAHSDSGGFVFAPGSMAPSCALHVGRFEPADTDRLEAAVTLMAVAMDCALFLLPQHQPFRPIVISLTGFSSTLMANALPYDSDAARAHAGLLSAFVTAAAEYASAQMARISKPFEGYAFREKEILQSLKDRAALITGSGFAAKNMAGRGTSFRPSAAPDKIFMQAVRHMADKAYNAARDAGLRNAHLTAVDTDMSLQSLLSGHVRDIAPEASLVRFEGYFSDTLETAELYGKKLHPAVPAALKKLGYSAAEIDDIYFYAVGHGTLLDAPAINHGTLRTRGFHQAALDALEAALKTAQHIRYVFNKWTLSADFCQHMLGFSREELESDTFDMLAALGFSEDDIDDANLYCCGTMTLEGAPHLKPAHLDVFDCAAPAGLYGVRRIPPAAHVRMQAAIEPFISGAVAHTVEMDAGTDIDGVRKMLLQGFELGVRSVRIFRLSSALGRPAVTGKPDTNDGEAEMDMPVHEKIA